jgi:hypothetical protein
LKIPKNLVTIKKWAAAEFKKMTLFIIRMEGVKMVYFGEKMVSKWYQKNNSHKKINFICNLCPFQSQNKKDFLRHLKTKKHDTKWYMTYGNHDCMVRCEYCDHISCDIETFNAHFCDFSSSKKPQKNPKKTPIFLPEVSKGGKKVFLGPSGKNEKIKGEFFMNDEDRCVCVDCGKSYKYKSGFYRHRKKCVLAKKGENSKENKVLEYSDETAGTSLQPAENNIIEKINQDTTNELLMKAIIKATETNSKLCERIVALENTVASSKHVVNNNNITNNINKQELNINVFLNQECKNAMNLKDFLRNIQLNIDDLDYTANNGYIKGITNIFIKNLEEMALNERPIHSIQENSNHQFYIKDENKWECDSREEKLEQSIDTLTKRQINKIKDWESQHPNWENSDQGIEEYMKIVQTIMGGSDENERRQNREKIKKELVNRVKLDTNMLMN